MYLLPDLLKVLIQICQTFPIFESYCTNAGEPWQLQVSQLGYYMSLITQVRIIAIYIQGMSSLRSLIHFRLSHLLETSAMYVHSRFTLEPMLYAKLLKNSRSPVYTCTRIEISICVCVVSFPDPTLSRGKGSGARVYRPLSWAFRLYESGDFLQ